MYNNHTHSEYSNAMLGFPDVVNRLPDLIQYAYDIGLRGISITEHEGISSHIQALKKWQSMEKDRPFTLGLGNEIYAVREEDDLLNRETPNSTPYYHFILLALDTEGHKQLRELSTRAWIRAWKQGKIYRRPTYYTDLEEVISSNQGHVMASSACLGSVIDKLLLQGSFQQAVEEANYFQYIFGKGNFYLEVQPASEANTDQSKVNRLLWKLHEKTNIPIIATTDAHYLRKEDAVIHKTYLLSQEGDREVDSFYATAYCMSEQELREYLLIDFTNEQIDKMFAWSDEIADRVQEYNILHDPIIPQIPLDKLPKIFHIQHKFKEYYDKYEYFGYYANADRPIHERYFFYQAEQGLIDKVLNRGKEVEPYIQRLNEEWKELKIISDQLHTSMPSYYSTMTEIIELIWDAGSLSMPARGSAAGFETCYLLSITQIDPLPLGDYMPSWRHLNHMRGVELPDIDNDSEASKKKAIVNKMKEFFGEDKVLNVTTFSKISAKTAIERACKGLGIGNDTAGYLKSLVPVNRGKVASLKECLLGERPIAEMVNEMAKYQGLKESALGLEGLITNRGRHAAGVTLCNEPYVNYVSAIRSPDGALSTCYDLWDSEAASLVKMDMLSVSAADKIHKTMDYLLANGKITWEGSLKATYYKWLHPDVLEYNNSKMWDILPSIYSVFQFDTPISAKALSATKPRSVMDLSAANSLLRLQPDNADETPIDRYIRYKNSHEAWVQDTINFGLNDEERAVLWEYLSDAYGLADSQEKVMRLSMDKRVAGYTLKESNKLRKSIAKKSAKLQEEAKQQFFEYGRKIGTREVFLDYIWNVVFAASMGYSFSQLHSYSYSIIALQELNLNYFYPRVYWNCACLSTEASGVESEVERKGSTDYSEIAKAIYKMRQSNIYVSAPSANGSDMDFTPREKDNTILFGLGGISSINAEIAQQIISNRPYASFRDFYARNSYQGTLITPSKFIQLIKAGCFDEFCPDRMRVMQAYFALSTPRKQTLTTANLAELQRIGCKLPNTLTMPLAFKKYVCSKQFLYGNHPKFKPKKIYWLDERALVFFDSMCRSQLEENVDWWYDEEGRTLVVDKSLEKLFKHVTEELKAYINQPEFLKMYNEQSIKARMRDKLPNMNVNHWSFEALSYYSNEHELACIDADRYNITTFDKLPTEPMFVTKKYGKREWRQYQLSRIMGTVIARNDAHSTITVLDSNNNVVQARFDNHSYPFYKQQISEQHANGTKTVMDTSWFTRGQGLVLTGYRSEDTFRVKSYKNSIFPHKLQKILTINEDDGTMELQSYRYGYEPKEE